LWLPFSGRGLEIFWEIDPVSVSTAVFLLLVLNLQTEAQF
jgi:hypothetical protein